jgi:hypothetical protein
MVVRRPPIPPREVTVNHRTPRADIQRLSQVLAGIEFPAAKWQLIMYAEDYGADAATRAELWSLPTGSYADLTRVFAALGLISPAPRLRAGYRAQPATQAAGRERPVR